LHAKKKQLFLTVYLGRVVRVQFALCKAAMWTSAGKPPPAPVAETPCRNYRTERQQSELDQLRQRGLAKLLNKHFTNVTHTLAEERAAADEALRDLEARKAAGLKDWDNSTGELSVWDKMYLELQQKKADCRRKERETLLLYQRYVDRFVNTGVVAAPTKSHNLAANSSLPAKESFTSTPTRVPHMAGQIESNLANLSGAERHPSIKFLGKDVTQQQAYASMSQQERINFMRSLEGRGVDARSALCTPSPQTSSTMLSSNEGIPESPHLTTDFPWGIDTPIKLDGTATTVSSPDAILDVDLQSIMSGLTTSGDFSDAERVLLDFLRTETEAIRKLLDDEDQMTVCSLKTSMSNELLSQSAAAADEAEDLVKRMEQMLRDFTSETKTDDAHEPRKLETSNPNEEWMIYWDDMVQRHYYYELRTHRAQWIKPSGVLLTPSSPKSKDDVPIVDYTTRRASSSDRSIGELSYLEVTHRDDVPRKYRREQYRKMRRRRRNRRLVVVVLLGVSAMAAALYMNLHYHQETKEMLARALGSTEQAELVIDAIEAHLPDFVTGRSDRIEKRINERIRQENAKKARLAAELKARLAAELKAKEEKERALQEKLAQEQEEEAEKGKNASSTFKQSLLCNNPHFFMVNNKRGLC
jgi:hypothetical protein